MYCVAYRRNLASFKAAKGNGCSILSTEVDSLVNSVATHFKKFAKRKSCIKSLASYFSHVFKHGHKVVIVENKFYTLVGLNEL